MRTTLCWWCWGWCSLCVSGLGEEAKSTAGTASCQLYCYSLVMWLSVILLQPGDGLSVILWQPDDVIVSDPVTTQWCDCQWYCYNLVMWLPVLLLQPGDCVTVTTRWCDCLCYCYNLVMCFSMLLLQPDDCLWYCDNLMMWLSVITLQPGDVIVCEPVTTWWCDCQWCCVSWYVIVKDAVQVGDVIVVYLQVQITGRWREEASGAWRGPTPVSDAVQPCGLHADDAGTQGGGEEEDPSPAGQVTHWPAVQPRRQQPAGCHQPSGKCLVPPTISPCQPNHSYGFSSVHFTIPKVKAGFLKLWVAVFSIGQTKILILSWSNKFVISTLA